MHRITSWAYTAPLEVALRDLGHVRTEYLHFDVLTGTDPVWAGLHGYRDTGDGRSYSSTAHVAYPFHQRLVKAQQAPTIVLPDPRPELPRTLVHEIGHVVDFHMGFGVMLPAITRYAQTNRREAFAVAFTAWVYPSYARLPEWIVNLFSEHVQCR